MLDFARLRSLSRCVWHSKMHRKQRISRKSSMGTPGKARRMHVFAQRGKHFAETSDFHVRRKMSSAGGGSARDVKFRVSWTPNRRDPAKIREITCLLTRSVTCAAPKGVPKTQNLQRDDYSGRFKVFKMITILKS